MLNRYSIERFEAVDDSKVRSAFLQDGKPSRSIGRVRSLVDTGVDLGLNDFANFLVNARRYWHISKYPGLVLDDGHAYWREEVLAESTSLRIVPSKSLVLHTHKVMHELALLRPKEIARMDFIDQIATFEGISTGGYEWRGIGGE